MPCGRTPWLSGRLPMGDPLWAIDRALTGRDVPLREKTLWRMLYEPAARA